MLTMEQAVDFKSGNWCGRKVTKFTRDNKCHCGGGLGVSWSSSAKDQNVSIRSGVWHK